jgi:hypothetical protein
MNTITSNPFRGLIASAILTALAPLRYSVPR